MKTEDRIREKLKDLNDSSDQFKSDPDFLPWKRALEWVLDEDPITDSEFNNLLCERLIELAKGNSYANQETIASSSERSSESPTKQD